VTRFFEDAWSRGNLDILDDIVDPGYRSHIAEVRGGRMTHWTGPGILRVELAAYRSGMPDCRAELSATVAERHDVAAFFEVTGTNSGHTVVEPFQGARDEEIEPTNMEIRGSGTARFRVEGEKIAAVELAWTLLGPLDQIRLFAGGHLDVVVSGRDVRVSPAGSA
jgi:SnoaL-like domain